MASISTLNSVCFLPSQNTTIELVGWQCWWRMVMYLQWRYKGLYWVIYCMFFVAHVVVVAFPAQVVFFAHLINRMLQISAQQNIDGTPIRFHHQCSPPMYQAFVAWAHEIGGTTAITQHVQVFEWHITTFSKPFVLKSALDHDGMESKGCYKIVNRGWDCDEDGDGMVLMAVIVMVSHLPGPQCRIACRFHSFVVLPLSWQSSPLFRITLSSTVSVPAITCLALALSNWNRHMIISMVLTSGMMLP